MAHSHTLSAIGSMYLKIMIKMEEIKSMLVFEKIQTES